MATRDSGKPTSPKRPAGAGQQAAPTTAPKGSRKRAPHGGQQTAPPPEPAAGTENAPRQRRARPALPPAASAAPAQPMHAEEARTPPVAPEPGAPMADAAPEAELPATEQLAFPEDALVESPRAAVEIAPEVPYTRGDDEMDPDDIADDSLPRRRDRRTAGTNALGLFIERQFANPLSPCHSYSDLERHSGISREALSRYVTSRVDRRRSPSIDMLVSIADALHVSLESVTRAAGASVRGIIPPPEDVQRAREEALSAVVAPLSDAQFSAVLELLRQMRPPTA
jgi:transcriptional regulator with XRE-family HTH domain